MIYLQMHNPIQYYRNGKSGSKEKEPLFCPHWVWLFRYLSRLPPRNSTKDIPVPPRLNPWK